MVNPVQQVNVVPRCDAELRCVNVRAFADCAICQLRSALELLVCKETHIRKRAIEERETVLLPVEVLLAEHRDVVFRFHFLVFLVMELFAVFVLVTIYVVKIIF